MTESPVEKPVLIFLAITGSTLLFAVMNMFVKLAAVELPVPQLMFARCAIGLIPVLFLIFQARNMDLFKTKRHSGHFVRSFIGFFSMCCFFWSFAMLPLANATAIHFAAPLILTALSVVLLDEKVGPHRWAAVLIGLGAVLFMLQPAGNGDPLGAVVAMAAAIMVAFALIAVRKLGTTEHALTIVFYFSLYSTLFSGIWTLFVWETPSLMGWAYMIIIGLLGGFGQVMLTHAYAKAPAAYVSAFSYLGLIYAALLDLVVWQHIPSWQVILGGAVVIASGLYIVLREARKHIPRTTTASIYGSTLPEKDD
jgi:drug/metabolite transporter (DMT)-like permease